ncbi:primosomal protein DnaI [Mariniplasma anaerobium]|uniref:Primosomal protein DnaI n=1 Tax=Mariniplasma anaerobium TaxID=2735436 RepID=A0A7U9XUW2_9MOLU|nr:primosomal protein DnaI [Mariniplasma anaerobium]BCR35600.1 primosomal protein DnaI [Mariniplasma anaerobium]
MTIAEMRQFIGKNQETKSLEVLDVDVNKVYQYLVRKKEKPVVDGYEVVLRTEPYIEIVYRPTKEKAFELKKERIRRNLKFYDSEVYIQDASISEFDCFNEERQKAHDLAAQFLENYRKDHYEKGMLIYGRYGTGKSYLLSAIAQELALKNIAVLFVYVPDLIRSIRQGMNDGNLEERINKLKQADILMLDDFGGENMSPWFRDEIIVPVLQYRLSAKLPVFMSSNFSLVQLLEALTLTKDETNRMKAGRLIQRIKDLMHYVKLSEEPFTRDK